MAVYVATYTNNLGHTVDLRIEDIDDVNEDTIHLADNPITVTYTVKDEDDIFSPIMTGRAEVRVMLLDDTVSTAFFEAMSNAVEGEFSLRVHTHNGAGTTYGLYTGFVVPDGMQRGISYINDVITIRAVDSIERAKSYTIKKGDGTQFVGRYTLKDYLDAILSPLGVISIGDIIHTDMLLSGTSTPPTDGDPIIEQLWVDASVFNDSNGRAINAYDALEMIVFSLGCRGLLDHSSGVPSFKMYEVCTYPLHFILTPTIEIGLKENGNTDNFLIGNREVITRIKTFKEIKGSFSHEGADGIVENGAMQFYDVDGKPQNVDVNAPLLALPDMNVRKRGNGRAENPYGFMLRSSYTETTPGNAATRQIDTVDMLAFKTPDDLYLTRYAEVEISVTARLEDVGYIADQTGANSTRLQYTAMIVDAIIYNEVDPANSVRSALTPEGVPTWETVDLTGNAAFAAGDYDFNVNARNNAWFAIFPQSFEPFGPIFGASKFISQYGTPLEFSATYNVSQTQKIELAPLPVSGRLHIAISQILDAGPMISNGTLAELNASTEMNTRIEGVLVSAKGLSEGKEETVYINRYGEHTTDKKEFEIKLNTTATPTAKGSLWTDVTYQDNDSKVGRFYRGPGWVRGVQGAYFNPPDHFRSYVTLVQYGALARMAFNGVQNKMDLSVVASSMPPEVPIKFTELVDFDRPSTGLYSYFHIQQMQKWNVTTGERDVTCISMKLYNRDVEDGTEQDTPTPTVDVMEKYYQ